jgi:hypothetical protein
MNQPIETGPGDLAPNLPARMKALRTFRGTGVEGWPRKGEFDSDRPVELERYGLALRIEKCIGR